MTREQYAALVKRVEAHAAAHPTTYRLRLAGIMAVGYAYVLLVFLLILVPAAGLTWWWRPGHTPVGGLAFTLAVCGAGALVAGRPPAPGVPPAGRHSRPPGPAPPPP